MSPTVLECDIIRLFDDEKMSYTMISQSLGITRGSVAGKIYRLRRKGLITTEGASTNFNGKRGKRMRPLSLLNKTPDAIIGAVNYNEPKRVTLARMHQAVDAVTAASIGSGSVDIMELKHHHCRWMYEDGSYCGAIIFRSSFCVVHANICFTKTIN